MDLSQSLRGSTSSPGALRTYPLGNDKGFRSECVSIGEVSLTLFGSSPADIRLSQALLAFKSCTEIQRIEVTVSWRSRLSPHEGEKTFDSGGVWSLVRDGSSFCFDFTSSAFASNPYKRILVNENTGLSSAELVMNRQALGAHGQLGPLDYPADELIFTNYLAHHALGVEVHGCGLIDFETGGHLLLGHSGAGKSTSARLWECIRKPEILSDDRIILRIHDGELWMYGTPWHGEAVFASPGKAQLKCILILHHGPRNEIRELSRAQAVGELFARCFPPFHSAIALERTLDFLYRVTETVPCYTFSFLPDESAVDTVLRLQ